MEVKNIKKRKPNLRNFLTNKLRRISYQWSPRKDAIKNGRVERGKYRCSSCNGIFGPKEIELDHTEPVIDPHVGFTNWDDFINRLFCDTDGFSIMCRECHKYKTHRENEIRKQIKRENEPDDGDI